MNYRRITYYPNGNDGLINPFNNTEIIIDSISNTEILTKSTTKTPFSDSISNTDSVSEGLVLLRTFSEIIAVSESVFKQTQKAISDSIANSETLIHLRTAFQTLSDSISNTDLISEMKSIIRTFLDSIQLIESIQRFLNGNLISQWTKQTKPINTIWIKQTKPPF